MLQQDAFNNLKNGLSSETVMTYFNPSLQIDILVDASPVEIGAIISQKIACTLFGSGEIPSFENTTPNNVTLLLLNSHLSLFTVRPFLCNACSVSLSTWSCSSFTTHLGLFRSKRLNFGISSALEIFQETSRRVIQNVQNAKNISDDIIIYGKSQEEHDQVLNDTLQALQRTSYESVPRQLVANVFLL
jgi:hypothetical protein